MTTRPLKTYASSDLKQSLGDVLAAANREPIAITRHKKPRYVLMSIEAFEDRFPSDPRVSVATAAMPSEHFEMIEGALDEVARRLR